MRGVLSCLLFLTASYGTDAVAQSEEIKVVYFGPPGVPSFPQTIYIDEIEDRATHYTTYCRNVTLFNLSSAYSLKYNINIKERKVKISVTFGNIRIQGQYLKTGKSIPHEINQEFEVNYYRLMISFEIVFQVQNENLKFDERRNNYFRHDTLKDATVQHSEKQIILKLLDAFWFEQIYEKISLDDVRLQIQRRAFDQYQESVGKRFQKTILEVLKSDDIDSNIFDVLYLDTTNFTRTVDTSYSGLKYDVSIPSFTLRRLDQIQVQLTSPEQIGNIMYAEDGVHLYGHIQIESLVFVARMVFRETEKPQTEKKTLIARFKLNHLRHEYQMFASFENASVGVERMSTYVSKIELSDDQAAFNNYKDRLILDVLISGLSDYITRNCASTLEHYLHGVMADKQIWENIFHDDLQPFLNFSTKT